MNILARITLPADKANHVIYGLIVAMGTAALAFLPPQMDTYRMKLEQAASYLAARALDAQAPVPAFIAAEAQALSQTNVGTCNKIINAATTSEAKLPQIEAARMGGKNAVRTAFLTTGTDEARAAAVFVARDNAVDSLNLL